VSKEETSSTAQHSPKQRAQLEAPEAERGSLMQSCFVGHEKVVLKDFSSPALRKGLPSFLTHVDPM